MREQRSAFAAEGDLAALGSKCDTGDRFMEMPQGCPKAIQQYEEAVAIAEKLCQKLGERPEEPETKVLHSMQGRAYESLGTCYESLDQFDKALECLRKSLDVKQKDPEFALDRRKLLMSRISFLELLMSRIAHVERCPSCDCGPTCLCERGIPDMDRRQVCQVISSSLRARRVMPCSRKEDDSGPVMQGGDDDSGPVLNFRGFILQRVNLSHLLLCCIFDHADLRAANFSGADLRGSSFRGALLDKILLDQHTTLDAGTDFSCASLRHVSLPTRLPDHLRLQGADLSHAALDNCSLNRWELTDATLFSSSLKGLITCSLKCMLIGCSLKTHYPRLRRPR